MGTTVCAEGFFLKTYPILSGDAGLFATDYIMFYD